jgi:hypothetical protein
MARTISDSSEERPADGPKNDPRQSAGTDMAHPTVCRFVRSKGAGVAYGDPVRWENGFFPTAVFWCLRTAGPVGPDDGFVHPHVCISGRECFVCDSAR